MIIRCCDLETTGLESTDEVVEIACYDVVGNACHSSSGRRRFVKPVRPIPALASAVHHITDKDVEDAPIWSEAWRLLIAGTDGEEIKLAAHMAQFERQWLDPLIKADWIDTWRCALRQWPELESHSLQAIRYALDLPVDKELAFPPHRAMPDAYVCAVLVLELLKHQTVETLVTWSSEPPVFTKFDFGQFKGKPLSAADDGYMDWLAHKDHVMGDDWRWNAKREIERRAAAKRDTRIKKWVDGVRSAATVRDLENWWHGEADSFAAERIIPGTEEYALLVREAGSRKALLQAMLGPVFDPSEAPQ